MNIRHLITLLLACCIATAAQAKEAVLTVKTARQFIEAIGPNRTIIIDAAAPLNITAAVTELVEAKKLREGSTYYHTEEHITTPQPTNALEFVTWYEAYDGPALQVRGVENLTIRAKKDKVTLLATPRYANVLEFINCDAITLQDLILGHTEEGYCDKGVVEFDGSMHITINDCDFFGCGTEGFVFDECMCVSVNRSTVYDCSYYTMHIRDCNYVRFNDCKFYDNREFEQICIYDSHNVYFTHCTFDNLQGQLFSMDDYAHFLGCVFHDCQLPEGSISSEFHTQDFAILRYCSAVFGKGVEVPATPRQKPNILVGRWTDGKHEYVSQKLDDYGMVFSTPDGKGFSVYCYSAVLNEYETGNAFHLDNEIGVMGANITEREGRTFLTILDDGGEPIKNLVYLGTK